MMMKGCAFRPTYVTMQIGRHLKTRFRPQHLTADTGKLEFHVQCRVQLERSGFLCNRDVARFGTVQQIAVVISTIGPGLMLLMSPV